MATSLRLHRTGCNANLRPSLPNQRPGLVTRFDAGATAPHSIIVGALFLIREFQYAYV